jgi:flagellar protein FliL
LRQIVYAVAKHRHYGRHFLGVVMKLVPSSGAILAGVMGVFWAGAAVASGGGDTFKEGVNYIPIKPHLVVNYGGSGKVKYIKAELSLRTEDAHSAQEVAHHMPLIRDTLIMLISSVTDEQMASAEGKEDMRLEALEKINEALAAVDNPLVVHLAAKPKPKSSLKAAAADDPAANDHAKAEAPSAHTETPVAHSAKAKQPKQAHAQSSGHGGPVSDLLFDNLVVQK